MTAPLWYMTGVLCIYLLGVFFVRRPKIHRRLMCLGIIADYSLTAYLEIGRGAFRQTLGYEALVCSRTLLFWGHIPIATALLVTYIFVWRSGTKIRGKRRMHGRLGISALILYLGSYLTAPGFVIERLFFS